MYSEFIQTPDKALAHLFLHICFKDGNFSEAEVDNVSDKFVKLGLQKGLNFKDEVINHKSFHASIVDETQFVEDLIRQINPVNDLALYSYCLDLGLSDNTLGFAEESLMLIIATVLNIDAAQKETITKLMVQRQVVATQQFF